MGRKLILASFHWRSGASNMAILHIFDCKYEVSYPSTGVGPDGARSCYLTVISCALALDQLFTTPGLASTPRLRLRQRHANRGNTRGRMMNMVSAGTSGDGGNEVV